MSDTQAHEMMLDKTHPSGAEEWYCPICGRRLVMQWPPAFKRIILVQGDEYALHNGSKGGLQLRTSFAPAPDTTGGDPWASWLNSDDTAKWWPDDSNDLQ